MKADMTLEIVEAITEHYSSEGFHDWGKDVIVDCLLWLRDKTENKRAINQWLKDNNYCVDCGRELATMNYDEPHYETDTITFEHHSEQFCPYCSKLGVPYIFEN